MSLYDDLDVAPDADDLELKAAHRAASKRHHPDKGGDPEAFHKASRAYMVLRDPAKRAQYDANGKVDDAPDNPLAHLAELVLPLFDQALTEAGEMIEYRDIIASTRIKLAQMQTTMQISINDAKRIISRLGRAKKRLVHKGDGFDFIGRALDDRVRMVNEEIAKGEQQIEKIKAAVEHIAAYGWDVQVHAAPPPPFPHQFMTFEVP